MTMQKRTFGRSGMQLSILGFGCGAVGGLMVRGDPADQERAVARALDAGINYFDTAVAYGDGELEKNLGRILKKLKPADAVVGTKVRLRPADFVRMADTVAASLDESLQRLGLERVDIFHFHNPITVNGGGDSLGIRQVLDELVPAFERQRQRGKTRFLGITAVGDTAALCQAIDARVFDSAQVSYNMLNPSAAAALPANYPAQDYGQLFDHAQAAGVGVVGIRVLAGGALSGSAERHPIASPPPKPIGSAIELRCRSRACAAAHAVGRGRICRESVRGRHPLRHFPPGHGHDPGRHGLATAVRTRAGCRAARSVAAGRAGPSGNAAAGVRRRGALSRGFPLRVTACMCGHSGTQEPR